MAEGIRKRHARKCRTATGGRCNCDPSWEAFVYDKRTDSKVRKTCATEAEAKSWRVDALAAMGKGKRVDRTSTTVREAATELLAGMRDRSIQTRSGAPYKPAAIRGYQRGLDLRVVPVLGDRRLSDVSRADVQALADRLTGNGLSASTVQNSLDPLRVIYRRAVRRDEVAVDPTKGLELRRPQGRRDRIADPAEAARLLAALPETDRALWATAMYAGLRRGELRALRWTDVDLAGRVIRVRRAWDDKDGEQDPKSNAAHRRVPILDVLVPLLAAQGLRTGRTGSDLVFGSTAMEPFDPSALRRRALAAWKAHNAREEAAAAAEARDVDPTRLLARIGLHESRHTCASTLIAAGANAKVIQSVMGHASITMTFDVYGHLMPGGLEEAAAAANAYLAAAV
jgi:integrase